MKVSVPALFYLNNTLNLKRKRRFLIYNKYFMLFLHLRKFKQLFDPYAITPSSFHLTRVQLDQLLLYQELTNEYSLLYLELLCEFIPVICFLFSLQTSYCRKTSNIMFTQTFRNYFFHVYYFLFNIINKKLLKNNTDNYLFLLFYLLCKVFFASIKTCFSFLFNILNVFYISYLLFNKKQVNILTHIASTDMIVIFSDMFILYKSLSFFLSQVVYKMILYQKHAINAVTLTIALLSKINQNQYFVYYNYLSGKLLQKFSLGFFFNKRKKKTRLYGFMLRQIYADMFRFLHEKEDISSKFYYLKISFLRYSRFQLYIFRIAQFFLPMLKILDFGINFKYPYNHQQFLYYKRKKRRRKPHTLRQIFQKVNKNPLIIQRNVKDILNSHEKQIIDN
jgi:hypothetical protein